ncbi:DUF6415 family natural product biosynthesis protein [Streptomyces luteireticuli]|uniref:DUF6415 family natural product biosynthesis protein n=1 Tax=Streptomyces luteireticuli TaxID=173858 RepID=UPI003558CB96
MNRPVAGADGDVPVIAPMLTGDTRPVDLVTIRATADRALQERASVPRRAEVRELTSALHEHLVLLVEAAQHRRDEAKGEARRHWAAVLNRGQMDLARRGNTGQSAVQYLQEIARTCRYLTDLLAR